MHRLRKENRRRRINVIGRQAQNNMNKTIKELLKAWDEYRHDPEVAQNLDIPIGHSVFTMDGFILWLERKYQQNHKEK